MFDFPPSHPHDPRTMEDFYHPTLIGRGGPIIPSSVPGTDFTLKNYMVRLIRQNCQFHGFRDEDANEHLNKYLSVTQSIKQNGVSLDCIRLNLFPFSLSHDAENWFYALKTHSIHSWEEMFVKFLSKYFPRSKMVQLRQDILNFRQLPMESVFNAWERFKSLLRKCPDHKILLLDQILTFYNGITSIDRDKIMLAAGGNFMRKTPQEAYDLIENMTQHHYQWDADVLSDHYSDYNSVLNTQSEVLGKQVNYISHDYLSQPGPGLPFTSKYSYSDDSESDDDDPSEEVNPKIDSLVKESDTLSMGDKEVEINPLEEIDDLVPIPRVSEIPFDSKVFKTNITNPLFDLDSEFIFQSDNPIFDFQNKDSDEFDMEPELTSLHHKNDSLIKEFADEHSHIDSILPGDDDDAFDFESDLPSIDSSSRHEEFAGELAPIISPPEHDSFYFDLDKDFSLGGDILIDDITPSLPPKTFENKQMSFNNDIQNKVNEKFDFENEGLILLVIKIFLPFFTFDVTSPILHSTGSEDTVFDPGIFVLHAGCPFHLLPQE